MYWKLSQACYIVLLLLTACPKDDVKLVQGGNANDGLLLVCYNDAWRAVCDTQWEIQEAQLVVCRQLGLPDAYGKHAYH